MMQRSLTSREDQRLNGKLRHFIAGVGAEAALAVQVGRIPVETVATALGTSEAAARRYVNSYRHP
ncbi:hypothetical protein K7B06_00740 [Streptomyces erythrochromogenes]|nr:hypothetical protein [Streptomyces erythrochromogenes]